MAHNLRPENFSRKDKNLYTYTERKGTNTNSALLKHHLAFTSTTAQSTCLQLYICQTFRGVFKWIIVLGHVIF